MSEVSKISPALGSTYRSGASTVDEMLVELVDQFKLDAMAIDPTITGLWLVWDQTMPGRDIRGAVQSIYLDRAHATLRESDQRVGA